MKTAGEAALSRDAEYLEFAANRTGHLFRSACLLTGGDTHLAEDLVQETLGRMYAVWRRSGRFFGSRRIDNPAGYAQGVLYRAFITQRRRRSASERPTGELPDRPGPEADSTLRLTLLQALARLSPRDRAVLVLRYWEDVSVEETAGILRCSSGAVRTQTSRALARLRALLGDELADLVDR
ncbi:SigE family RNA polymerase sigma factor [Kitasatospora paracochleata]|uniref:RNA polymerase sigma-70 factor (Sigma-E family) n=1 Tax=Kitasatospora paracochleata TaxID=58354 RepID=A0ABT1IX00_9ACTN|nr:SigE family RNA polymerase sigma factor [Kitasatospora paracochleata]MCP2309589.1 RNA polymerase sigma-70 factor (sigma-E family) [Kitasatospora paracochleata]